MNEESKDMKRLGLELVKEIASLIINVAGLAIIVVEIWNATGHIPVDKVNLIIGLLLVKW
jgi:hypothetical protein